MLSSAEIASFTRACVEIGNELSDDRGFVAVRDLLKRFRAQLVVRPLLVEGMIASIDDSIPRSGANSGWTVLVDSDTHPVSQSEIDNENRQRPLSVRFRNTVAHELVHTLAFRASEFGVRLQHSAEGKASQRQLVQDLERVTESLSPLLLFTDKAIARLVSGRTNQVSVEELDTLRIELGISRDVMINRLGRLRTTDGDRYFDSLALRGLGIGKGEWANDGTAVLRSWPLYINFDQNIAPMLFRRLVLQGRMSAVVAFPDDPSFVLCGGSNPVSSFMSEAGLVNDKNPEQISVECSATVNSRKPGSVFLFMLRRLNGAREG